MSLEREILRQSIQTLHKQAVGKFQVEVVDEFLTPWVRVASNGRQSKFDLDKLGIYYSDGDNSFRWEEDDSAVESSELNDRAIEAFLRQGLFAPPGSSTPREVLAQVDMTLVTLVNKIIAYESGELSEEEVIALFQGLLDSGLVWQLQGHYGRMAAGLINAGYITPPERGRDPKRPPSPKAPRHPETGGPDGPLQKPV